jgi:hypothetical protein
LCFREGLLLGVHWFYGASRSVATLRRLSERNSWTGRRKSAIIP